MKGLAEGNKPGSNLGEGGKGREEGEGGDWDNKA